MTTYTHCMAVSPRSKTVPIALATRDSSDFKGPRDDDNGRIGEAFLSTIHRWSSPRNIPRRVVVLKRTNTALYSPREEVQQA